MLRIWQGLWAQQTSQVDLLPTPEAIQSGEERSGLGVHGGPLWPPPENKGSQRGKCAQSGTEAEAGSLGSTGCVVVATPQETPKWTSEDRGWTLGARSSGNSMPPASQGCSCAQIVGSLGTEHRVGQMTSRHRGADRWEKENNPLGEPWSFVLAPTCTSSRPSRRPLCTGCPSLSGSPSLTAHLKRPRPPPAPSPSLCSKRCPVPACWGADIPEATTSAPREASVNNAPTLFSAGPAPPNSRHRQRGLNLDAHRQAARALQVCLLVKKCENHPRANTSQKRHPVDRIGRWGGGGDQEGPSHLPQ